ncbi:Adhesion G protein-coupled receptor B3 [Taenia solium]|eukprot:TsM_001109900 transcript=TsM_001109900 gene=TsM_001109900
MDHYGSFCLATWVLVTKQTKDCSEALSLGECQPFWAPWTSWSACSATCGVSERSRYRPCGGAYSVVDTAEAKGSCADPARAAEGFQKRDCPLQRLCPRIAGGWGEWSAFSACDATCGRGNRRRIRLCNRPPPQGGGVPCQGIDTQQGEGKEGGGIVDECRIHLLIADKKP